MDVIIFQAGGQLYAVDADSVLEVIDPQPVTPLPFVSSDVEGLINVAGRIMTQICAQRRLKIGEGLPPAEGSVIVFSAGQHSCACRVSRVMARTSLDQGTVSFTPPPETDRADVLLKGEWLWNGTPVLLLDPGYILREQWQTDPESGNGGLVSEIEDHHSRDREQSNASCGFPLLLFTCRDELFAIRCEHVGEIVECLAVNPVPGAPADMAGIMILRGRPLPLFSLRAMLFGTMSGAGATAPYALVMTLNGFRVGLQVEQLLGITRFESDALRPLSEEQSLLEGFVTTGDERLVAVIRYGALAAEERLSAWRSVLIVDEDPATAGGPLPGGAMSKLRLLMFRMGRELMALPLETVERVEEYSEPSGTPGCESGINGVIQVQGVIIPVRAIEAHIGLKPAFRAGAFLIVSSGGERSAIPVDKVERIFEVEESSIEPTGACSNSLLCGIVKFQNSLVSLLDIERLFP